MNQEAQFLSLGKLKKWKFGCTVEYRTPFFRKIGKAICKPDYYNKAWRAWFGAPTKAQRDMKIWAKADQLCVMCSKACGGCSWSDNLEPVEGWTAIQTYGADGLPYSYEIRECPEFAVDSLKREPDYMDEDGAVRLIQAALSLAREDYIMTKQKPGKGDEELTIRDEVVCFLADWVPDYREALHQLHADRNFFWGKKHFDAIFKKQPVLLYAGGDA